MIKKVGKFYTLQKQMRICSFLIVNLSKCYPYILHNKD